MKNTGLILFGKTFSRLSKTFNLGNGSTWPGHIALKTNPHFVRDILKKSQIKIIFIAGTNGKTTTSSLIKSIIQQTGNKVFHNASGANLLNGIASSLIVGSSVTGKVNADYAIFEIDENTLPLAINEVIPDFVILLNLFRDQLDRYGEVNTIAKKWQNSLEKLPESTSVILNADDPLVAYLGKSLNAQVDYFGLNDKKLADSSPQHAVDSTFCPNCGNKLNYKITYFSHLGDYRCNKCEFSRPKIEIVYKLYSLPGTYNRYNTLAAVLLAQKLKINKEKINNALKSFTPAFGRQEVVEYKGKKVQLFLSKNPTSFNQSFITMSGLGAKTILLVLNDRIPDGRDVSWIWDADLPHIDKFDNILISGDRVYDMALRVKYEAYTNYQMFENLEEAINKGVKLVKENETLFVLPTYSAMLETRKILTGKKIL